MTKRRDQPPPFPGKANGPLYFGCGSDDYPGHHVFRPGMKHARYGAHQEWLRLNDGCFPPGYEDGAEPEGRSVIIYPRGEFTLLAFWDRSVDKRHGSHSVFLFPGLLTWNLAISEARKQFPEVMKRLTFDVTLDTDASPKDEARAIASAPKDYTRGRPPKHVRA